jgi:hypothetical protein
VGAFGSLTLFFWSLELELYVNAFNDENAILRFFNFSAYLSCEPSIGLDFARLQRAPEGSQQSTRYRCDQVIDRGCVGFSKILGIDPIMLRNCTVHAEYHRLGLAGKLSRTNRPPLTLDMRLGYIGNITHLFSSKFS